MLLAPFFGGFSLGYLAGFFYDQESALEQSKLCYSAICYRNISIICAALCGVGIILVLILLVVRKRKTRNHTPCK
jgi:hypothetical protein